MCIRWWLQDLRGYIQPVGPEAFAALNRKLDLVILPGWNSATSAPLRKSSASPRPFGATSTIVDVSPFSTNGAIVVANVKEKDRNGALKRLMFCGGVVVALAPLVMWALLVLPGGA